MIQANYDLIPEQRITLHHISWQTFKALLTGKVAKRTPGAPE
jgi:hypothetical protein